MKKNIKLIVAALMVSSAAFSQGFYVELNAGYGLASGSDVIDYNINSSSSSDMMDWNYTDNYEVISGSFGRGFNFGADLGYMFNSNVGVSLYTNYLMGHAYTSTYSSSDSYTDGFGVTTSYSSSSEFTQQAQMLRLTPSLILALPGENMVPFAKIGVAMGVVNKMEGSYSYSNSDGDTESMDMVLNGGVAFGLNTELGLEWKLNEKLSFVSSLNALNMSYAPKKGEITSFKENGVEQIGTLTTRDKEVEFLDSYTSSSNDIPDENKPAQSLKDYNPFGSVGVRVGLRFNL